MVIHYKPHTSTNHLLPQTPLTALSPNINPHLMKNLLWGSTFVYHVKHERAKRKFFRHGK